MKSQIIRAVPLTITIILASVATIGAALTVAFLTSGWTDEARNAATIPTCLVPMIMLLFWLKKDGTKSLTKTQTVVAAAWVSSFSATAAYIVAALPIDTMKIALSTPVVNIVLWLVLAQITRKIYRAKRQSNIAKASGRPVDDPEVLSLANNTILATAIAIAVFTTAETIILFQSSASQFLSTAAARVVAIFLGTSLGLAWFSFCPKQCDIRDLTGREQRPQ